MRTHNRWRYGHPNPSGGPPYFTAMCAIAMMTIVQASAAASPSVGSASAPIHGPYQAIDFQTVAADLIPGYNQFGPATVACPPEDPYTSTAYISAWISGGYGGPYKVGAAASWASATAGATCHFD